MVAEMILVPSSPQAMEPAKQCAQYVARSLNSIGVKMREQISLCSGKGELQKAIAAALGRSNIVLVLGGLSAQQGYLAKQVVAKGLNLALEPNAACLEAIRAYCARTGDPFETADQELAMLPQGAVAFPGQYGKIPGCAISSAKQHIILMPDNQQEAAAMLPQYIAPYLSGAEAETAITRTVRTYGVNAEQVRAQLCELLDTANPAVTLEKDGGEIMVRVSAHAATSQEAAALCTPVLRDVVDRLGDAAYGLDVDSLQTALVGKLKKKCLDMAVAESGSGGIVTRVLSETPGGTEILRYSKAAEDDAAKQELGVAAKTLKKHGGISEQTAVAMAAAVREKAGTDLGLAITAQTDFSEKNTKTQAGLVYIAVCDANNVYVKKLVVGSGDPRERDGMIDAALSRALNMARLFVDYLPRAYKGAIPLQDALAGKTVTDKNSYDGTNDGSLGKQDSFLKRLGSNFIIRKADEPTVKVRKFIFILAVLVFLGSAGYVGMYYYDSYTASKQKDLLSQLFFGDDEVEISDDFPEDYLWSFASLWSINPDVAGYISIDGTNVQYPVMQADDNDYYLRRDFYAKNNEWGIPFMDYRVRDKREPDSPSDNLVVYGHNMRDGQIFGELAGDPQRRPDDPSYRDLEYYKEHPVIDFSTVYEERQYKIFSIFITNAYSAQGTPLFEYHNFINANSDEDFLNFVDQVRVRSIYNIPVDVEAGDKLLTLSTCVYDFTEARLVIVARQVRDGEDPDVDVDEAEKNPTPLYPDIWYSLYGGTKPSVNSATVVTEPTTNTQSTASESSTPATNAESSQSATGGGTTGSGGNNTSNTPQSSSTPQESSQESSEESSTPPPAIQVQPSESESSAEAASSESSSGPPSLFDNLPSASSEEETSTERDGDDLNFNFNSVKKVTMNGAPSLFDNLDIEPPSQGSTYEPPPVGDRNFFWEGDAKPDSGSNSSGSYSGQLTVSVNGKRTTMDASDLLPRIVQKELGSNFHGEAVKAQAIAAYSYIAHYNNNGQVPAVVLSSEAEVSKAVRNAVGQVAGQAVYYNDTIAFTPYHATAAGKTTSSASVWGGSYPYLVSVDSSVDKETTNYKVKRTFSSNDVSDLLYSKLGVETYGNPSDWFNTLTKTDGGYVDKVLVCGETKTKSGETITGRLLRENVLGLRSAAFTVKYDSDSDTFTFTTSGYGHGVGLSQNGANLYARQGWTYKEILAHYYPGTTVK